MEGITGSLTPIIEVAMYIKQLNEGACKTYMLACEDTGKALLIDPIKSNIDRYLAMCAYKGFQLEAVVDTHTHADHATACFALNDLTDVRIIMARTSPVYRVNEFVDQDDEIVVGNLALKVLITPGHTPDRLSLYINGYVFTGDCLLIGGTGRCDFAGGDAGEQYDSITQKLFALPDDTVVLPAHDYRGNTESSIGAEKSGNPRVAGKTRDEYIELMNNMNFPLPGKIQEVLQPNQTAIDDDKTKFPDLAQLNKVCQLTVEQVEQHIREDSGTVLLDVREEKEFTGELGHIENSVLIPLNKLSEKYDELDKSKPIICICRAGVRSTTAAAILNGFGFENVYNLKDGMLEWNDKGFPVHK